jgi:teichuronic acid biosynthesis glycosyltransferase TuaH
MIQNRDIIVIGIQPWDIEIGSNCKNMAQEMALHNRVLYINPPLSRFDFLKGQKNPLNVNRIKVIKGEKGPLTKISENLWVYNPECLIEPINQIPVNRLFDFFNSINSKRFAKEIKRAAKQLDFQHFILFNDSSMFLGNNLDEYLDFDSSIYYIRDNLANSTIPYWCTNGKRIEAQIIRKADVVVTNSVYYTEYARQYNPNSFMVGQGCDTSLFDYKKRAIVAAEETAGIKRPIIGYVGNLTKKRLDLALIEYVAKTNPTWSIVLVGPEDIAFQTSALHQLKNVHFLGAKPEKNLPEYIQSFDVCFNPQVLNIITIGNYPRKIDEYLAMGKPVVATQTKAMDYFKDHTYLGTTQEDYITLIQKALDENSTELAENRNAFALTHSWKNNVDEIWKAWQHSNNRK